MDAHGKKPSALAAETSVGKNRWHGWYYDRIRAGADMIEAAAQLWPHYAYWLTTGKTLPEAGQNSPQFADTPPASPSANTYPLMRQRLYQAYVWSGLSTEAFESQTGISWYKWQNLFSRKQRVNEDHVAAADKLWPQFTYWIATGQTLPEAGQISPEEADGGQRQST